MGVGMRTEDDESESESVGAERDEGSCLLSVERYGG